MSTSLFQLKAATEAGSAEQKRLLEKRRNVLVLVHQHLMENGGLRHHYFSDWRFRTTPLDAPIQF